MKFPAGLLSAAMALMPAFSAFAQPVDGGHARVDLISEREVATPGETVWFGLSFQMDDEWHIYWKNAGDAGIPPAAFWDEDIGVDEGAIGEIDWPLPELIPVVEGEIMDYGYSDRVVLPFPVEMPQSSDGPVRLSATIDYLICKDICIPECVDRAGDWREPAAGPRKRRTHRRSLVSGAPALRRRDTPDPRR